MPSLRAVDSPEYLERDAPSLAAQLAAEAALALLAVAVIVSITRRVLG